MSQVRNIVTNRMINSENARYSSTMGGYIHRNVSTRALKGINLDTTLSYHCIIPDWDFVTEDWLRDNGIQIHLVMKGRGGRIQASTFTAVPSVDLSAYNHFELDGKMVYTNIYTNFSNAVPTELTKEVSILEYGQQNGGSSILTYKQFVAMTNRPASTGGHNPTLRIVGSEVVPNYMFDTNGLLCSNLASRRATINGERVEITMQYNSPSYDAYQQSEWDRNSFTRSGIFSYHGSGSYRQPYNAPMRDGEWYFGIEAEKQDTDAKEYASYLNGRCGQWGAESDSSLGRGGVEFISPILPLHNGSFVRKNFQQHRWMLDAKLDANGNADRTRCGGHMTISKKGMSGRELLTHLHHFVPLFYSLYIGRLNTTYGGAVAKSDVAHSRRAFNLKSFGVEIRIFAGVPSMEGAWWRVQLLQVITNMIDSGEVQSYKDVANALVTDKHPLRKVMRKQYDSKRIRDKFALVLAFGHMYENNGSSSIDISGTSSDVKHKSDRVITAFNQFRDVRSCTNRLWGVDSITTTEG